MIKQEIIGKIIQNARLKKGLTLQELAEKIGVTAASISRWENGEKNILGENLIKIAIELDIVSELFPGYKKEESPPIQNSDSDLKTEFKILKQEMEELKRSMVVYQSNHKGDNVIGHVKLGKE